MGGQSYSLDSSQFKNTSPSAPTEQGAGPVLGWLCFFFFFFFNFGSVFFGMDKDNFTYSFLNYFPAPEPRSFSKLFPLDLVGQMLHG